MLPQGGIISKGIKSSKRQNPVELEEEVKDIQAKTSGGQTRSTGNLVFKSMKKGLSQFKNLQNLN